MPIGLALIDQELVSLLTLITGPRWNIRAENVPIGLAMIDEELVSALTLIADELYLDRYWFENPPDGVGHLLHLYNLTYNNEEYEDDF